MKLGFFILNLFLISAQDSDGSSEDGPSASTDATDFAGTYSFIYYSNQDPNAKPTTQLPCKPSQPFQLSIPEGEGGDVERDIGSSAKDPIYRTSQSSWTVMEVGKGNGFNILKMNLYLNDDTETIVCWALKKSGQNIIANINPRKLSECPTKYVPLTDTCTLGRAALVGTCISGACNGTRTKSSHATSQTPSFFAVASVALLAAMSL